MPQTIQHVDKDGTAYFRWYNFADPAEVLEEIEDRLSRGDRVGIAAVLKGDAVVQEYREAGTLLKLLTCMITKGRAGQVIALDIRHTGLSLIDNSARSERSVSLHDALATWPRAEGAEEVGARAILDKFSIALSGTDYLSSFRDSRSQQQIEHYLSAWSGRKRALSTHIYPPPSETLLLDVLRRDAQRWAETTWLPVVRFFAEPAGFDSFVEQSLASAAERSHLLPITVADCLEILSTRPTALVPPKDLNGIRWRGRELTHRSKVFEELREIGLGLRGGSFILLPHLEAGGAELVGTLHLRAWLKRGEFHPRIILTEHSTIVQNYSNYEDFTVNLPEIVSRITGLAYPNGFTIDDRTLFLRTLLEAATPARVFCVQSYIGSHLLTQWKPSASVQYAVFCPHVDEEGRISGYQHMIPELDSRIDTYISDNLPYEREIQVTYGIEGHRVQTVHYPPDESRVQVLNGRRFSDQRSKDILWASRLDHQKNPTIVVEIARLLPDMTFHMYGRRVMEDTAFDPSDLPPNVIYHGEFSSLADLMVRNYLCFLYTSRFDGMPNTLLEIAHAALPIVTPKIGGLPDFFGDDWPSFVADGEQATAYADMILAISRSSLLFQEMLDRQFSSLNGRSTVELFRRINAIDAATGACSLKNNSEVSEITAMT